jgi:hypothetical protein
MNRAASFILMFVMLVWVPQAWSAACCGGGVAFPSLISGDQRMQWSATLSQAMVAVESVDDEGYWSRSDQKNELRTIRLDGSMIFSDRFQVGWSVPVLQRVREDGSETGLGDVSTSLGYEFLTDWDYHPIRPKGIAYFQLTLPTGLSRYESQRGGLDSRGQGFWSLGLGALLTKTVDDFDFFVMSEAHRSIGHRVNLDTLRGQLSPGWGGSLGWGAGYNLQSWRVGGGIQWFWESEVRLSNRLLGATERFATGSLQLSYLDAEQWAWTASYTDQTWFGSPQNTSLARAVILQIQRRWAR